MQDAKVVCIGVCGIVALAAGISWLSAGGGALQSPARRSVVVGDPPQVVTLEASSQLVFPPTPDYAVHLTPGGTASYVPPVFRLTPFNEAKDSAAEHYIHVFGDGTIIIDDKLCGTSTLLAERIATGPAISFGGGEMQIEDSEFTLRLGGGKSEILRIEEGGAVYFENQLCVKAPWIMGLVGIN